VSFCQLQCTFDADQADTRIAQFVDEEEAKVFALDK
jgi:hypothetical protein